LCLVLSWPRKFPVCMGYFPGLASVVVLCGARGVPERHGSRGLARTPQRAFFLPAKVIAVPDADSVCG
jgi:hypothetical protein